MILLGILCGLTLNIAYGPINIGEVIFLLYGIFYLIKSKKIRFDNNFKLYIIFSVLFILYTMIYFQIDIIETRNILKNIFKYLEMLILTILAYQQCLNNIDNFLKFMSAFLITDFLTSYFVLDFTSLSSFIHYSVFLLPIYILITINYERKIIKILLYIVAFILSFLGNSRSSLLILLVTFIYQMYQYILMNSTLKKVIVRKILVLTILGIVAVIGLNYFIDNLSFASKSNMERTLLIQTAFMEIKDNFIFGVGPGNFNLYAQNILGVDLESEDLTTHNHFLEIFVEWGFIGFIIYMIPFVTLIKNLIIREKINLKYKNIYIFYFVFLFFNVLSGDARIKFAFILALMFYDLSRYLEERNSEKYNSNIEL